MRLVRNRFITTPMLVGIIKPCIIIPDINFNEKQLKNILLHEISHLRRFDITIKWLTMITASIHWFNPLMYFIKKEINHACELSCDEAAIKNLNSEEKQAYGDTLISVVAEHKYPIGILQATMCEEKKNLKERLTAIMSYNKKSRFIIVISVVLLAAVIIGAVVLGTSAGTVNYNPPRIYISAEGVETKTALTGTYSWKHHGINIQADSDHPVNFKYKFDNIINVTSKQQIIISTQKLKLDKKYNFTIDKISVYKDGKQIVFESPEPSFTNKNLYLQAPPDAGEYIYCVVIDFEGKGKVSYGFAVRVDMLTYNLSEISKYKTSYIGNNSKVSAIVSCLPVPNNSFKQQYISMLTSSKPYKLNVFYEVQKDAVHTSANNTTYSNLQKNALVLFCMVDNLDEVTFAFRNSQSDGKLDTSKYDTSYTFSRVLFEKKYGDLSAISKNLDLLEDVLTGETVGENEGKQNITHQEKRRMDLYVKVMKAAFQEENGGNGFIAVKLDTLKGLSNQAKEELLKELSGLSPDVYSFEDIKNDNTKFELDDDGRLIRTINGALLWVKVEEYTESKAVITGISWFGNLGAVFPKYEAAFKNGMWKIKLISMAVS